MTSLDTFAAPAGFLFRCAPRSRVWHVAPRDGGPARCDTEARWGHGTPVIYTHKQVCVGCVPAAASAVRWPRAGRHGVGAAFEATVAA